MKPFPYYLNERIQLHSIKLVLVNKYIFTLIYISQFRHIRLNQTWFKKLVFFTEVT